MRTVHVNDVCADMQFLSQYKSYIYILITSTIKKVQVCISVQRKRSHEYQWGLHGIANVSVASLTCDLWSLLTFDPV